MHLLQHLLNGLLLLQTISNCLINSTPSAIAETEADIEVKIYKNGTQPTLELPKPILLYRKQRSAINFPDDYNSSDEDDDDEKAFEIAIEDSTSSERRGRSHRRTLMDIALQESAKEGLDAMTELYRKIVPDIIKNGQVLADNHPAALLSKFSAPVEDTEGREMAAYAAITATKAFKKNYKHINVLARQAHTPKISLRRTALEGLCPPRDVPTCMPASERYRTHDGTCNNKRRLRWGSTQMPFNRYLPPEYGDGVDTIRNSVEGGALSSSRFVSLLVHGAKDGEAPLTLMTAQWGQLLDHDMTSTAQPRSINGSVPSCCGSKDFHPSCFPIKVPLDDPWLAPLKVRCLEFLRSAPAQRRDCVLSWREQTNQATSYIDASPIYSSSAKSSDNARVFHNGLLVFGRGSPAEDVCQRGAIARQCIRAGDGRSGEQPGLLALHHVWVGEHNLIATELSEMNPHWSDEKVYQETRRIIGAMFQHITYREFLPIILGREVCKLFDLNLMTSGYYEGYDPKANPTVANSFAAAAFRFGHSLVQNSYMRCDRHHNVINNNVSLHEEFQRGDIGSAGSLHRLLRGMATQRVLKRDEFITPELTNHLFQTPGFPFGLDLAAINIQRGRDHGIAPYTSWRVPCGLTPINNWDDFSNVVGDESARRISHAYRSVHDIDLFVGGISERPVVGGLVGPTFACIIAQQFSNSRKGDRFWYENVGFESTFTPAQLHSIRRVSLAQVLCRAVGGGTFQPHIFIPHDFPENKRVPCGTGPLTPIDLGPWLEHDPFSEALPRPTFETPVPDRIFDIVPTELNTNTIQVLKEDKAGNRVRPVHNLSLTLQHRPHVDFIPNSSSGFQRPTLTNVNNDKINDKLDFKRKGSSSTKRPTKRPVQGVNNKLDKGGTKITLNIKGVNRRRPQTQTTTRRTVIVNNVPIELRSAAAKVTKTTDKIEQNVDTSPKMRTQTKTKKRTANNITKIDVARARADDIGTTDFKEKQISISTGIAVNDVNDEEHIAEEDIFDIFSTLTEPPTERKQTIERFLDKLESRTVDNEFTPLEKHKTAMKNSTNTDNKIIQIDNDSHTTVDKKERRTLPDNAILSPKQSETVSNMGTTMTKHLDKNTQTNIRLIEHNNDSQDKKVTEFRAFAPITDSVAEIITNSNQSSLQDNETDLKTLDNSHKNSTTLIKTANNEFLTKEERINLQDSDINPMTHSSSTEHKRVQRNFDLTETVSLSRFARSPNLGFSHRNKNAKTNTSEIHQAKLATSRTNKNPTVTTRIPKITKLANVKSVELRQYQSKPLYTRPQKVIVDGPNSDQYEIEINIRQTNKSPAAKPGSNYAEYTTAYRPYGYDRYSNNVNSNYPDYTSTTPIYAYYQPPPSTSVTFAQIQRTKPPTVIYINEHDEQTTTRQPGLLHNFLSFATSGFGGNRHPISQNNAQNDKDKPVYSTNRVPSNGLTSSVVSRPHSAISSPQYNPNQQQLQSPLISSSFSQVGSYPGNSVAHASSTAVSNGHYGSITGVASANGADSTFSFNIRPRPSATAVLVSTKPTSGGYGLLPPRRPPVSQSAGPQYISAPVAYPTNDQYYPEQPNREELNSPFSIGYKKPAQHHAYDYLSRTQVPAQKKDITNPPDHKLDITDYDYLSRTLETNNTSREISESDSDEKDDYSYNDGDDDDENEKPSAKFDRDGYLRPEHMLETLLKNHDPLPTHLSQNNATLLFDDNFVLPVLNNSTQTLTDVPTPIETATAISTDKPNTSAEITTNYPDAQEKHLNNDLLAEDYDEDTTDKFIVSKTAALTAITSRNQHKPPQNLAFAPIKILTKPERPDNWVIYETPVERPLLPEQPTLNTEAFTASEFPMPFTSLNNVWLTKYRNKLMETSNKDLLTKHSLTDILNKTIQNNDNTDRPDSTEHIVQSRDIQESTDRTENTEIVEKADMTKSRENTNSTENSFTNISSKTIHNTENTGTPDSTEETAQSTDNGESTDGTENTQNTEKSDMTDSRDNTDNTENTDNRQSTVKTANIDSTESADTAETTETTKNTQNTNSTEWTEITRGITTTDSSESTESTEITDSDERTETMNIAIGSVLTNSTENNESLQRAIITDATFTDIDTSLDVTSPTNHTNSMDTMKINKKLLKTQD